MDQPLEIAWRNTDRSDALEARIRDRVEKMHRYFSHITSVHVVVEVQHRSQKNNKGYRVRVEARVPGTELVSSKSPEDSADYFDPNLTVRDVFDAMDRQLENFSQKVRGDVKTLEGPPQGRVVRKFSEYGFIETLAGEEIWFSETAVTQGSFADLKVGDSVELTVAPGQGAMGSQASMVRPIGAMEINGEIPSRT
ncbi:HPF/RaiA family ribosome-associated protein [Loktanella sp. SALINAS62]|uniref:HPF/RaiA family ribosome-associated protein n=1 Tax=Loktanella sp. SALINAS62 TaxID=2706124 RepID=UPI001B8C0A98|nr:HPF/RaiA family ribosome-associated protein [Loktanella sp. SALINAS62]MBS1304114.1 HPF/RaiA family ribosome-associated protein [Loktanella sp. SALINAS62]